MRDEFQVDYLNSDSHDITEASLDEAETMEAIRLGHFDIEEGDDA